MLGIARHFLAVGLAAGRTLAARNFRSTVLRNFGGVSSARIMARPAGAQISDRDRLTNSASMLPRRSLGRDNVRVATRLGDVGFGCNKSDSTGAIFAGGKNLQRIESGLRVAAGAGVSPSRRDRNRLPLGAQV